VIEGYLPLLARLYPTPRRTIEVLRGIRDKLAPLLEPGGFPEGRAIALTMEEVWALDIAVQGFSVAVRRRIAPSNERDGVIAELNKLHVYCERLLSAGRT